MIGANIIRTFFSRSGSAAINLLVVIMSARFLGDEGMGMISLLILATTMNTLLVGLWGGAGLVYLTPRNPVKKLLVIGYSWSVIASLIAIYTFQYFNLFPDYFGNHVYLLAIIISFGGINMHILLGKEKIKAHNIITFIQSLILLSTLLIQFFLLDYIDVNAYLWALYFSFSFVLLSSSIALMNTKTHKIQKSYLETFKQTFKYSITLQSGSAVQLLNYRFSYYIIDYFLGTAMLGRFSVAVQIAEGTLILGKSLALVLYSRVSNITAIKKAIETTLPLLKITAYSALAVTIAILLLPANFFVLLFGSNFEHTHGILLYLAPGIVFVSATMVFSSFFSGIGQVKINTQGSIIGLITTLAYLTSLALFMRIIILRRQAD
ncbi:MAG: hypothetical protein B7C24_15420 [Bacteroidetes bacterium 4572_77]|nr:MAG: hypothetical protein B7C24_15420 [Bacteroidetes bacterium 4572_77]